MTDQNKPDERNDEEPLDTAPQPPDSEEVDEVESADAADESEAEVSSEDDASSDDDAAEEELSEEESEGEEEIEDELEDDLFLSPDDEDGEVVELVDVDEGEDEEEVETSEDDEDEAAAALAAREERIEELEQHLEELAGAKEEINTRMLRVAADLENYRRRSEREKAEMKRYGIDRVIVDLIPAVDNMERALAHAEERGEESPLVEGIEMVYRQFNSALKKHGVEGFESKGDMFDPQRHEAIQQVETTEHETGTVVEQYQKGYFLHDRLIRPALVSVAKRIEPPADEQEEEEEMPEEEIHIDEASESAVAEEEDVKDSEQAEEDTEESGQEELDAIDEDDVAGDSEPLT